MTRTRVRWPRVAVVSSASAVLLWGAGWALGGSDPVAGGPGYRVEAGDTLWEIARRRVGPAGDPRPLIADIRQANGMTTSALTPGQVLILPGI